MKTEMQQQHTIQVKMQAKMKDCERKTPTERVEQKDQQVHQGQKKND